MRLRLPLLLLALVLVLLAVPAAGSGAATKCPAFTVLHNDRIGRLQLPAGPYNVTVTKLSCPESTALFAEFLQDFDGRLPRPWGYTVQGVGRGTFRNSATGASFTVSKQGGPTPPNPPSDLTCRQRVSVPVNDRIGPLQIPKGTYEIVRLGARLSCGQAVSLFNQFLLDFDGNLPDGWTLIADSGAFVKGSLSYGFRIKKVGPNPPTPNVGQKCPATFRVLHNDRIGPLRFPAGPYWVFIAKGANLTCPGASKLFAQFLARPSGNLPRPWRINAQTGTFVKGRGPTAFRAKPAFNAAR